MFTGLVETTGKVRQALRREGALRLTVAVSVDGYEVSVGDSVAVNGVCLTAESLAGPEITFSAVYETLSRSTLGSAKPGDSVNLERALRLSDRLGGHVVLGHVDGTGRVADIRHEGAAQVLRLWVPPEIRGFMAEKGSVALDGVSLTIAKALPEGIEVSLVPHTVGATNLLPKARGDLVNIECDILARYILHLLKTEQQTPNLHQNGQSGDRDSGLLGKLESLGF